MLAATVLATAALGLAIVTQEQTALRAAPAGASTTQALLAPGDLLEVRGQRQDHLQVYDHQRERAGYVRAAHVRPLSTQEADAPQLLAVLRFLRDMPGMESLGIAYTAAYLKAVPAKGIDAEPFDALGTMAERLARRATSRAGRGSEAVAAQLEAAGRYGVKFTSFERDGAVQVCYDGDAFRRVLAVQAQPEPTARAALALTRHDCLDPALPVRDKQQFDRWCAEVLDRIAPAAFAQLPETVRNRLRLRRAGVWAAVAFARSREGAAASASAQAAARRAIDELAVVDKTELSDDDMQDYAAAAVRTGASRWAAEPGPALPAPLAVQVRAGEPGQSCVLLTDAAHGVLAPLLRRCTYATVWPASLRVAPDARTAVLAVQPLEAWTELWVMRASAQGWTLDALPPAASVPDLGYVEFAGWVPGAAKMLLAREARVDGRMRRSFEVLALDTLEVDRQAAAPQGLNAFSRWQDSAWKAQTLILR